MYYTAVLYICVIVAAQATLRFIFNPRMSTYRRQKVVEDTRRSIRRRLKTISNDECRPEGDSDP